MSNATSYELARNAYALLRLLLDAGAVPAAHQAEARHAIARWEDYRVFNGLAGCPTCDGRGIASGWVKDSAGREEHLDYPCHCPAGAAIEAELQGRGRGWEL